MATWSGFNVSSSPFLRLLSYSVKNSTQIPFLSPLFRRRLLAERFGLATIVVSRQDLLVSSAHAAAIEARVSGKREPMVPPYNILITGSTKGYALAREFLKAGDNVVICSRSGSNAYSFKPLADASDEDLIEVVKTNTLGLMLCCREAMNMMLTQSRGCHIFNIDGAGLDGKLTPSVVHLTKSLQAELQMQDVKNVVVHNFLPGMVTTDLLMSGATTKQVR
ncbi:hypothetical protein CARUB_v10007884mg [Capsella rubella]|uniref:Uncharacterized protein n=1 Tax=Capsella rubella TaxID=81985 RepID=R0EU86_9BRAS|nr:hypothetical protein CARUB_v10007884mg [Capsella rubella]